MDAYAQLALAVLKLTLGDLSSKNARQRADAAVWLHTDYANIFFALCGYDQDACLAALRQRGLINAEAPYKHKEFSHG